MSRQTTRPRGFAPWAPQAAAVALLEQVQAVVDEYRAHLPLTVRQIFYRLVGAHGYDKTEQAYARLGEMLNRARRARLIEMDVIRDDGGHKVEPANWRDGEQFLQNMIGHAQSLRLDRTAGQPSKLVVICEAAGMVPQLARVAEDYGLPVFSSGGFESVTEKHQFARDLDDDRPAEVLHIGDHDPSGVHLFTALAEDVQAFAGHMSGAPVTFTRLAVTPAQIRTLRLPTAPPKATDRRAFNGVTCQAEAIPPDALARILREAIQSRTDADALQQVRDQEQDVRRQLLDALEAVELG